MAELKDANTSPAYLALTVFGEQPKSGLDAELARLNRAAWTGRSGATEISGADRLLLTSRFGLRLEANAYWGAVFSEAFARRCEAAGVARPGGDMAALMVLDHLVFERPADLSGYVLPEIGFAWSEFRGGADFSNAQLGGKATFYRTTFGAASRFDGATFGGVATFKEADFEGNVNLQGACFEKEALFGKAQVKKSAFFNKARFEAAADFEDAEVSEAVWFTEAEFARPVRFNGARFGRKTVFSQARFRETADFYRCSFGHEVAAAQDLTFANAIFEAPTSFEAARFPDRLPVLSGTTLHQSTKFSVSEDLWPPFRTGWRRRLGLWLGLSRVGPKPSADHHRIAKESASKLRHAMAVQALPEEEHFFFRREMHHAGRTGPVAGRLPVLAFEAVSEFGYSIARPTGALIALWAGGAAVFARQTDLGGWEAAGFSFANMFKFFGLQRTYFDFSEIQKWDGWVQWVSGGQTVLAFVLLFFLGLGLRTRFRLR